MSLEDMIRESMQRTAGMSSQELERRKRVYDDTNGDPRFYDSPMDRLVAQSRDMVKNIYGHGGRY